MKAGDRIRIVRRVSSQMLEGTLKSLRARNFNDDLDNRLIKIGETDGALGTVINTERPGFVTVIFDTDETVFELPEQCFEVVEESKLTHDI